MQGSSEIDSAGLRLALRSVAWLILYTTLQGSSEKDTAGLRLALRCVAWLTLYTTMQEGSADKDSVAIAEMDLVRACKNRFRSIEGAPHTDLEIRRAIRCGLRTFEMIPIASEDHSA